MALKEKVFRATAMVTLVIILSKSVGFVRDMIIANYFGTSTAHDAYQAAYSMFYLPVLLLNSSITSTVVPLYLESRRRDGDLLADRNASNTINCFAVLALVIGALFFALSIPVVGLVYRDFPAEKALLTARLLRIMLLTISFNVVSIVLSSLLNAREKYIPAQLTGFSLSLSVILAAVLFPGNIEALAWGVCIANFLQTAVLVPSLLGWFRYKPVLRPADPFYKKLMRLAGPAVLSMAVSELNHMIDQLMASGTEGGISAMTLAYRLITFMTGILIVPLTTIMFSRMSKRVTENDREGILEIVRSSVRIILLVMLPIVVVAAVMNQNVIQLVYMRGAFNTDSLILTSGVFLFYVIGVLGFGVRDLLNRTFHSLQKTRTTMYISFIAVGLNIVLNFPLRAWLGVRGLALATTVAGSSAVVLLFFRLKREFGSLGLKKIAPDLVKIVLAGGACLLAAFGLDAVLPAAMGTWPVFFRLAVTAAGAVVVYAAACVVLREQVVWNFLKGRRGK